MTDIPAPEDPDALFGSTFDALDDLLFMFDEEGRLRRWNQSVVDTTGYGPEELTGTRPTAFIDGTDAEGVGAAIEEVRETEEATVEATLVTRDGDRIPYEFKIARVTDAAGTEGFLGIGRDITDGRPVERERRAILDRMTDAFFAVDDEWRLTYVNERARSILATAMGRTPDAVDDLEGLHLWESIPEAVDTPFYERYHEAMASQESIAFEEYYEPLETWFEVRAYPSESGLSVYFRDITERRRQRAAVEERERLLREVYELTSDTERSFAERVEALLELGCEVLGLEYGTLSRIRGEDYVFEVVRAPDGSIQAGDIVPLDATNCERTAARRETLVLADIEADAPELTDRAGFTEWGIAAYLGAPVVVDGAVHGTFCFYDTDPQEDAFTEWEVTLVDLMSQWVSYELTRQRTQERLERQNDQLEDFVSIVSHDLRNPLNVLSGWLDKAEETGDPEPFRRCRDAIDRMETLIENLLTLARTGEPIEALTAVDIAEAVRACWDTVETGPASVTVDIDRRIRADESRLRQLLENLIRNAIEHAGPDVTVRVGALEDGFYVEDDGPGIPPDDRERVFESGYSTNEDGTGLGLSIVSQVADAHGWTVTVTESETGGTRFAVTGVEFVSG